MIHILSVHFVDDWVDMQLEHLTNNIKQPYKVYTVLGENYEEHKDKFYYAVEGKDKHYNSLQRLHKVLDDENIEKDDIVIILDSDAFPIVPIDDYLQTKLEEYEFLAISAPEHNYKPTPIQPFECFYAFKYEFFKKYDFWFKFQPGIHKNWIDWMIDWFEDKKIEWYPLNRSNKVNLHSLYFGIYDNVIYHHWAGSRNPISRSDRVRVARENLSESHVVNENISNSQKVFKQLLNESQDFFNYLLGKGEFIMIDKIKIISLDMIDVENMTPIYERAKYWGDYDYSRWVFKDESTELYYKIWNETYVKRNGIISGLLSGLYDETTVPALVGLIFWKGVCRGYVMEHLGDVANKNDMISDDDYPKFYNHILQKVKNTNYFPYDLCQKHMRKYKDTISLMDLEGVHHVDEYEQRLKEHNDLGIKGLFINNQQWEKDIQQLYYEPLSEEDFLNSDMHTGKGGKEIILNGYELKTTRDVVNFYSDMNNVKQTESKLIPSNWQYYNCMMAEFRHNVGDHHELGWENMTKEYYESLPKMSDDDITLFLKDNPVPFEVGFIKHGFHRACSMIGRLINGKSYIPFYMSSVKYGGYFKNPIDNVNFIRTLDEFGIPRTEYSVGNSAILAVMGIDCRVNKNGDLDIVLSSKLRKFLERSGMVLPNCVHPFGKDSGKFRAFGCKDDDDLVYNYSMDINGYNFIEPRFYFSRMHRLMPSAHRSFEDNRRIKELGKIGVDEFNKKQKYKSKPFRNIEYEKWGFDLVKEVKVV